MDSCVPVDDVRTNGGTLDQWREFIRASDALREATAKMDEWCISHDVDPENIYEAQLAGKLGFDVPELEEQLAAYDAAWDRFYDIRRVLNRTSAGE